MAPSTACLLLSLCQQVAPAGMEYFSRKKFVHHDLAARNILVTEEKTCKVHTYVYEHEMTALWQNHFSITYIPDQ